MIFAPSPMTWAWRGKMRWGRREATVQRAKARVDRDVESARASGVQFTPTFFINGRRYDGPWDESSFSDAMLTPLGYRVRTAALSFASWAPSTGVLLLLASVLAVGLINSPLGPRFDAFWHTEFGFTFGRVRFPDVVAALGQ